MNKIVNIYSLSGKNPFLAFTTLSLFPVILEESNIKKKNPEAKTKKPQPTNLIQTSKKQRRRQR